jgi:hypothetical protein
MTKEEKSAVVDHLNKAFEKFIEDDSTVGGMRIIKFADDRTDLAVIDDRGYFCIVFEDR